MEKIQLAKWGDKFQLPEHKNGVYFIWVGFIYIFDLLAPSSAVCLSLGKSVFFRREVSRDDKGLCYLQRESFDLLEVIAHFYMHSCGGGNDNGKGL